MNDTQDSFSTLVDFSRQFVRDLGRSVTCRLLGKILFD